MFGAHNDVASRQCAAPATRRQTRPPRFGCGARVQGRSVAIESNHGRVHRAAPATSCSGTDFPVKRSSWHGTMNSR
jgi:hypothetical protein